MSEPQTNRQLADGTRLLVREVVPEDRSLIQLGFEHFGPESRYQRFLSAKAELTDSELRYLAEVDGSSHFAIGAVMFDEHGVAQPVGIARYVRFEHAGEVAEPAVAVVDEMQGKGVGTLLLRELSDAAYARGVRHFRCRVLTSNAPISALLHAIGPHAHLIKKEDGVNILEIDLPTTQLADAAEGEAPHTHPENLLRLIAQKLISWIPSKISG